MLDVSIEVINDDHVHKYLIARNGQPLSYTSVWSLWQRDESFRSFYIALLADSPFAAYRWETPPVTSETTGTPFEFVLVDAASLSQAPDTTTFAEHFSYDDADEGLVVFGNLGRDAMLVVPSPRGPATAYAELAAFVRGAPIAQIHALWRVVGREMQQRVCDRPLWLSTAGGGVAWLHVRLDSRPKYYTFAPYRIR